MMDAETLALAALEIRERTEGDPEACEAAMARLSQIAGEGDEVQESVRLQESGEHHKPGDVWQGPSGHWFTITASGHVAPHKAPGKEGGAQAHAAEHPLAFLKATHGIDLTDLPPEAVEAMRKALAPAAKEPKPAAKPAAAETPPHLVAAADKVKALASKANDHAVSYQQIEGDLDALGLDKLPLADLQALGRHLRRDGAELKTKAGALKAIRRIPLDAKELLVKGGG
jgi:hypothetical protein